MPLQERCVAHPSRPAVDHCPVCGRPRCGTDTHLPGCVVCAVAPPAERVPSVQEVLVRGGLGGLLMAYVGGPILAEYVSSPSFSYVAPAVVGLAIGEVVLTVAGRTSRRTLGTSRAGTALRAWAALMAVLSTGLGFVIEGSLSPAGTSVHVLVPYLAAAGAAWLWTMPTRRGRTVRAARG